ncbi:MULTISPECIES: FadR/GntR family transcriptional regulator [Pseudomonas syringae group genomosp. 2]|uniref:Transcriptional regulator, GntR family n=1 Tax=Pseudomonas amygdali pv. mori TaxID=34065 RepID=A0A3M5JW16_PSEA0|nr:MULTISPECIES: FadR/GntR family transcriptional regulator [Pseudomonas syringae group genomosp. 2]RMT27302.1 Transcriptional regulator, GntR family [Pseudomonas amygdali pv. mori]
MLSFPRPHSLVEGVVSAIRREIVSGRLPAESKMPTEHELADQFSVSRSVVREAISQLKADGVLVIRRGSGSFVSQTPGGTVFRLPSNEDHSAGLAKLFELRSWIEIQVASVAAQRHTDADLKRLSDAMLLMESNAGNFEISSKADCEFHCAIVAACKNEYLTAFHDFLGSQLIQARFMAWENSSKLEIGPSGAIREHREIYDAIAKRNPSEAAHCARMHLKAAALRLNIDLAD